MSNAKRICAALGVLAFVVPGIEGHSQNLMATDISEAGDTNVSKRITIGLNKSVVVEIDAPAADVVITNPGIADATVQTAQRMIFRGVDIGETNAFIFDQNGRQLLNLEIRVEPDTSALSDLVERHVPDARVTFEPVNNNIIISGLVDNLSQSDQVMRLANAYLGVNAQSQNGVINMLQIGAPDQVLLQVRIVEMQRTLIKQLGINLDGNTAFGELQGERVAQLFPPGGTASPLDVLEPAPPFQNAFGLNTTNAFNVAGSALGGFTGTAAITKLIQGQDEQSALNLSLQALERVGVVRTLAEPNITALSGEPANFLAGGEFPVPVGQNDEGAITIEFKPFGVGLGFTPIVMSEGRISLRMSTEVSELSSLGAFDAGPGGITIPALSVRRAETTIELPSGGSMMIAGLIESSTRQTIDQVPGLRNVPVLGALFRSRDFANEESELVIIVTPYLVEPNALSEFRTPDEGFASASDAKTFFFGKLNRVYGDGEEEIDATEYAAPVGFIEE